MAQFSKVNGDFQQVLHLDAPEYNNAGLNAVTDGAVVQPQGPKLDFFTATAGGDLSGDEIAAGFQTIQQLATVYIYQYNSNNGSDDTLAIAVYPTGAYDTTSLASDLGNLGGNWTGTVVSSSATFSN